MEFLIGLLLIGLRPINLVMLVGEPRGRVLEEHRGLEEGTGLEGKCLILKKKGKVMEGF